MLFLVVFSVLSFLNLGTDAVQKEEIPKFYRELGSKEASHKSSDIIPLLGKLISELEDMKGQILNEIPEQLAKQGEKIEKISNDLENVKGMIKDHANKTDSSIAKQTEEIKKIATEEMKKIAKELSDIKNCCAQQSDESKNNRHYLRRIETSVNNVTAHASQISESLQVHDQRLQNFANEDFCDAPRDCSDIRKKGFRSNGVYRIYLNINNTPKDVYCDFSTPGGDWMVFQRRRDGSVNFYQNWNSYTNGFGNPNGEFWLGNEVLFQLTSNRRYKLRVDMEDFQNQKRFAEYSTFSVGPSSDYYRLRIGSHSGTAGDSLSYHNNQQFSTHDVDRDQYESNCATQFHGAWWYNSCHHSNLNGRYYSSETNTAAGNCWYHLKSAYQTLKTSEMKISRLN